jgi:LacI family transcriptional regulator
MKRVNKRVTTTDIAKIAGVSQTTVSFVLNGRTDVGISSDTFKRVIDSAIKIGYLRPDVEASFEAFKNLLVGFIAPDFANPAFTRILASISKLATANNISLITCNTDKSPDNERTFVNLLLEKDVSGIIYTFTPTSMDIIKKSHKKIPVVVIGDTNIDSHIPTVGVSGVTEGEIVAAHLFGLGHREIAYITPPINSVSVVRAKRLSGITSFLKSKETENTFYVYEQNTYINTSDEIYEINMGRELANRIIKDHNVTAIIAQGDLIAVGVYEALKAAQIRIPEEISVIGFDNIDLCKYLTPPLTTVDSYIDQRSRQAFEHLFSLIKSSQIENQTPLFVEYRPSLIIRGSTSHARTLV